MSTDYAAVARRLYDLINAGDIDGFGTLLADDFVEHEETPGLAPTRTTAARTSTGASWTHWP